LTILAEDGLVTAIVPWRVTGLKKRRSEDLFDGGKVTAANQSQIRQKPEAAKLNSTLRFSIVTATQHPLGFCHPRI
jgi:hypothetical protein